MACKYVHTQTLTKPHRISLLPQTHWKDLFFPFFVLSCLDAMEIDENYINIYFVLSFRPKHYSEDGCFCQIEQNVWYRLSIWLIHFLHHSLSLPTRLLNGVVGYNTPLRPEILHNIGLWEVYFCLHGMQRNIILDFTAAKMSDSLCCQLFLIDHAQTK